MNKICEKLVEPSPEFDEWWRQHEMDMHFHQSRYGLSRKDQCKLAWLASREYRMQEEWYERAEEDTGRL